MRGPSLRRLSLFFEVLQLKILLLERGDVGQRLHHPDGLAGGVPQHKGVHDQMEGQELRVAQQPADELYGLG